MNHLPSGTVTFLFTDVEGSTRLWEEHPDAMRDALARHDEILRETVEKHAGHVVKTTGDGLHAVFSTAHDALAATVGAQQSLDAEEWRLPHPLQVRMGVHSGEAELRDGDYYGSAVNRAARIAAVAHGGQIVCSRATEELARDAMPSDVALRDLGDHQLRDLARPEHCYQVEAPTLRRDFPPLRSLDAFPGNLPRRPTSFVGRDVELGKVAAAVERSPIVTITGVGGVGKTRLALQVAAEIVPHYPHGAWLCELAAADSPSALHQVVAATLGTPIRAGVDPVDTIVEFLRGKKALLVLDNCEHLVETAGAVAEQVAQTCSDVRIIATSREGLAVDGEQVFPLRSLAVPEDPRDLDAVTASAAVNLFVERARAAKGDLVLRPTDLAAAAEICRRLDGIPLAIELAAARVVAMTPAEIAGLLDERFRLLTGGRRTAVERHQTLRATVDWSYSLLDDRSRAVFDRLGVFAGTFGAEATAAVVAGDGLASFDVLDALTDLVAKSLVVTESLDDGSTRYALLETLRQYARERLDEQGTSDEWRQRHAEYFAGLAEALAPELITSAEFATRRRLHLDIDNLRAAIAWSLDRDERDDAELGVRIAAALHTEAAMGRSSGIMEWIRRARQLADSTTPSRRFRLLLAGAWDAHALGDVDRCIEIARQVIAEPFPDDVDYATSIHVALASASAMRGRLDDAVRVIADALTLAEAREEPPFAFAITHAVAAMNHLGNGGPTAGRDDAEEALRWAREARNPSAVAMASFALGWALALEGDSEAALAALTETIELCESGAIDAVLGPARLQRAVLQLHQGALETAVPDLQWGFERSVEISDVLTVGAGAMAAAHALVRAGLPEPATVVLGALDAGVVFTYEGTGFGLFHVDDLRAPIVSTVDAPTYREMTATGAAMTYDDIVDFVRRALGTLPDAASAGA